MTEYGWGWWLGLGVAGALAVSSVAAAVVHHRRARRTERQLRELDIAVMEQTRKGRRP